MEYRQSMLQTLTSFPQFASHGRDMYIALPTRLQPIPPLLLAPHRRKAYMARNWKREWIPRAIENVRTLWRKRHEDKVPIVHLWAESTEEPDDGREINQLSRRLASNSIPLLTVPVKGRHH